MMFNVSSPFKMGFIQSVMIVFLVFISGGGLYGDSNTATVKLKPISLGDSPTFTIDIDRNISGSGGIVITLPTGKFDWDKTSSQDYPYSKDGFNFKIEGSSSQNKITISRDTYYKGDPDFFKTTLEDIEVLIKRAELIGGLGELNATIKVYESITNPSGLISSTSVSIPAVSGTFTISDHIETTKTNNSFNTQANNNSLDVVLGGFQVNALGEDINFSDINISLTFSGLKVNLAGYGDTDKDRNVSYLRIMTDNNGNGKVESGDTNVTATFIDSNTHLDVNNSPTTRGITITKNTPKYFLFVADIQMLKDGDSLTINANPTTGLKGIASKLEVNATGKSSNIQNRANSLASISYSGGFTENKTNDGNLSDMNMSLTLVGADFNLTYIMTKPLSSYADISLPAGITLEINGSEDNNKSLSMQLHGKANEHNQSNSKSIMLIFKDTAFQDRYAKGITEHNKSIDINFTNPYRLTYSGITFTEKEGSLGVLEGELVITLSGSEEFNITNSNTTNSHKQDFDNNISLIGIGNKDINLSITSISAKKITIKLTQGDTNITDANGTITFNANAFKYTKDSSLIENNSSKLNINFADYRTTFDVNISVIKGWNLISIPNMKKTTLEKFAGGSPVFASVWSYNGAWSRLSIFDYLETGKGYWINYYNDGNISGDTPAIITNIDISNEAKANAYIESNSSDTTWNLLGVPLDLNLTAKARKTFTHNKAEYYCAIKVLSYRDHNGSGEQGWILNSIKGNGGFWVKQRCVYSDNPDDNITSVPKN